MNRISSKILWRPGSASSPVAQGRQGSGGSSEVGCVVECRRRFPLLDLDGVAGCSPTMVTRTCVAVASFLWFADGRWVPLLPVDDEQQSHPFSDGA